MLLSANHVRCYPVKIVEVRHAGQDIKSVHESRIGAFHGCKVTTSAMLVRSTDDPSCRTQTDHF